VDTQQGDQVVGREPYPLHNLMAFDQRSCFSTGYQGEQVGQFDVGIGQLTYRLEYFIQGGIVSPAKAMSKVAAGVSRAAEPGTGPPQPFVWWCGPPTGRGSPRYAVLSQLGVQLDGIGSWRSQLEEGGVLRGICAGTSMGDDGRQAGSFSSIRILKIQECPACTVDHLVAHVKTTPGSRRYPGCSQISRM
jgi:hypothetical protein